MLSSSWSTLTSVRICEWMKFNYAEHCTFCFQTHTVGDRRHAQNRRKHHNACASTTHTKKKTSNGAGASRRVGSAAPFAYACRTAGYCLQCALVTPNWAKSNGWHIAHMGWEANVELIASARRTGPTQLKPHPQLEEETVGERASCRMHCSPMVESVWSRFISSGEYVSRKLHRVVFAVCSRGRVVCDVRFCYGRAPRNVFQLSSDQTASMCVHGCMSVCACMDLMVSVRSGLPIVRAEHHT